MTLLETIWTIVGVLSPSGCDDAVNIGGPVDLFVRLRRYAVPQNTNKNSLSMNKHV